MKNHKEKIKEGFSPKMTARNCIESRDKGKIVADWFEDGLRIIVLSLYSHFTAYVGLPINHPLSEFDYNDLPVNAHGGLTFGGKSTKRDRPYPENYYWYGWDYAHLGDYSHFEGLKKRKKEKDEHDWTLGEVIEDCWNAIYDFKRLRKLAENIVLKKYPASFLYSLIKGQEDKKK